MRIQGLDYSHGMMVVFYSTRANTAGAQNYAIVEEAGGQKVVKQGGFKAILDRHQLHEAVRDLKVEGS